MTNYRRLPLLWLDQMPLLDETCFRLQEHFETLKAARAGNSGGSLYALEHSLSPSECDALHASLQDVCKKAAPNADHWLGWIVFATELGYSYSGSDYWPRLEARIPDWRYAFRNQLSRWFERFASEFAGACPSGPWARQFCLIAWPITHAILPRDLQVQLSYAIYNARHYLFGLHSLTDSDLGRIVASRKVAYGDRFDQLMQREEFVGTLVRSLLEPKSDANGISQLALQRILSDVERHSEARAWLRDARVFSKPTARVVITRPQELSDGGIHRPRFSPELVFEKDSEQRWRLWVQPGSLLGLIAEAPKLSMSLRRLRFAVLGNDSQAFAADELGRTTPRKRQLNEWPRLGKPVLQFLPADDPDARLLTNDCVLAPRELWLFKIHGDGSAWLQAAPTVNPGSSYLFATIDPKRQLPGIAVDAVVPGLRLSFAPIPPILSNEEAEAFRAAGLSVSKRTTFRPWGVLPRTWREDGRVEYVYGEPILLQLERNHAFDSIRVGIDAEPGVVHSCLEPGSFLLEIKDLAIGDHRLVVNTLETQRSRGVTTLITLTTATIELSIRPCSTWHPDTLPSEALAISLAPTESTLDQLLRAGVDFAVDGTANDTLNVSLAVFNSGGERRDISIVRRKPPISVKDWHRHLEVALRDSDLSLFALAATRAHLDVRSENFGCHRAELAVFPKPLRWGVKLLGSEFWVKLYSDAAVIPQVVFFPRQEPCTGHSLCFDEIHREGVGKDGLYVASVPECLASLVLSCPPARLEHAERSGALGTPRIEESDPVRLLKSFCSWSEACTVGRLAPVRLKMVTVAIRDRLVGLLAGSHWLRGEKMIGRSGSISDLDMIVDPVIRNYGINLGQLRGEQDKNQVKDKFISTSFSYRITTDRSLADFAWRLIFEPHTLRDEPSLRNYFANSALPVLVRGARLLELGLTNATQK